MNQNTENFNELEILIVEDNPNDAEMTFRALKKNKITNKIFWVKDGEEALDFLWSRGTYSGKKKSILPKIILLDLKLPKVNGLEVLKEIKTNPETAKVPVIMLTSSSEETDIIRSYQLGVNSYIVKPVDFDKFVEAVREIGVYWLLLNQAAQ